MTRLFSTLRPAQPGDGGGPRAGRPWRKGSGARTVAVPAVAAVLLACSACGSLPQPWEKDVLARPDMAFDASALEARLADHLHASKEGSSGGGAAAGAGCGCN